MLAALLEALFIVLMLGLGLVAAIQIAALYIFPRDRRRALPSGHYSDRVTTRDIDQANRAAQRDAEAVAAFTRARLAAGGCLMLNGVITRKGWTLTQHNGTGLWTAIKGGEKLPAKSTTASLRALIDAIEGPEARECCTWKGWTLTKHNGTGLWAAIKGGEKLPAKSTTASLRALIDAIEGPQVKECCTGGGCHV